MNLLLIEDDAGLIELITEKMEELEFSVTSATSGAEAFAHLNKQTPDLMVLDYSLPDISGKELIKSMNRQQKPLPPFIITTGQGDERIAVDMMKLGAKDYLVKDQFFLEKLPDVVKRMLKEIDRDGKLKQTKKELIKSEEKYRLLFESMNPGVVYQDGSGAIIDANPSAENLLGLTLNQMMGRTSIDPRWRSIHEDGSEFPGETHPAMIALKTGKPVKDVIMGIFNPTKNIYNWIIINSIPRYSPGEDKPFMVFTTFNDITKRKKSEENLLRREQQYYALSENNPDNIMRYDNKLRHIYANQSTLQVSGYSEEEYIGKTHRELGYPSDLCEFWEGVIKDVFKTGENHSEIFEWQGPEKLITLEWRCIPEFAPDGSVETVLAISRDITERKHSENQLAAERERLAVTLQSIGDGVITTDVAGNVVLMNRVSEKLTGWIQQEAKGKPLTTVFHIINEQTGKPIGNPVENVLATGEIVGSANHIVLNAKEDTEYLIADSGAPIFDKNHEIIGTVLVFRDITEEHRKDRQLHQAQKLESVGILAGGIAHDFNNILAGIMNAAELLKSPKRTLDDKGKKYVDLILQASERAADLVAKLLAFGRKGKNVSTTVDIHKIVDDTLSILNNTIDKKIVISVNKKSRKNKVIGDDSSLQNALLNLCINASHAMPDGGRIQITTRNVELNKTHCTASTFDLNPGEYCEIEVSDTGCGIPFEDLNHIFEPFYTTKEQGKGTGLGLSAVYGTIQDHHGSITVNSAYGSGTTFNLLLPCSDEEIEVKNISKDVQSGSGLILLVDDEELIQITGKIMLEEFGYNVLLAGNGHEAVEIFQKQNKEIDLVIMDMIMPEVNGREAFYKMKEIDKNCKIIFSSGFTKNENISELKESGLLGFLRKPFRDYELSQLLAEILSK